MEYCSIRYGLHSVGGVRIGRQIHSVRVCVYVFFCGGCSCSNGFHTVIPQLSSVVSLQFQSTEPLASRGLSVYADISSKFPTSIKLPLKGFYFTFIFYGNSCIALLRTRNFPIKSRMLFDIKKNIINLYKIF